jgi:hypothetical protein
VANGTEGVRRYANRHGFPSSGSGAFAHCPTGKCPHVSDRPQADLPRSAGEGCSGEGCSGEEGTGEEGPSKEGTRWAATGEEDICPDANVATCRDENRAHAAQADDSITPVE